MSKYECYQSKLELHVFKYMVKQHQAWGLTFPIFTADEVNIVFYISNIIMSSGRSGIQAKCCN